MISLHDYFIQEKLRINKNAKLDWKRDCPKINVDFPVYHYDGGEIEDKVWKTFKMPKTKYVIFKDMYRGNLPHFASMVDFCLSITFLEDDYENFNPDKDILYASDDLRETLNWYFDFLKIDIDIDNIKDEDEVKEELAKYNEKLRGKTCDYLPILGEIYLVDNYDDAYANKDLDKDFYDFARHELG